MNGPARQRTPASALSGNIGRAQYFALGFGSIVGSGWVVIAAGWLKEAGPGGAILGFLLGGLVMLIVGACYGELASRVPEAGGEFIYTGRAFGRDAAFLVGWFQLLFYVGVLVFEGLALGWIIQVIWPGFASPNLYTAFGSGVQVNALLAGIAVAIALVIINAMGVQLAARLQAFLTYGFLVVAVVMLVWMLFAGHAENMQPFFAGDARRPGWHGILAIFAMTAFLLNGFQAIPQAIEERDAGISLTSVARLMMLSIAGSVLFYWLVIAGTAGMQPWRELIGVDLATAVAASKLPIGALASKALLLAALASLIKTWNAMIIMASRLTVAMARAGMMPSHYADVHPSRGSPLSAILLAGGLNIGGLFLGRGAIDAIINMCAMTLTLTFVTCCLAVLVLRRRSPERPAFVAPGGTVLPWLGAIGGGAMSVAAFLAPFDEGGWLPLEYCLLLAWTVTGMICWILIVRHSARPQASATLTGKIG